MFSFIWIYFSLLISRGSTGPYNTFVFSGSTNSYIAFDSWRACLTDYIRFDIRTTIDDGTLAYIDDRGRFDFFYLKILQGKLRLLFNLGNDRQALNVNMKINDNQWHTILIKRNGHITSLNIDNGLAENFTITHSDDLYFGGANDREYDASLFYFGGIPSILERPSSGNLSSFDVYMQARFRGQLRNLIYKNCTNSSLIQPIPLEMSGGVSLIANSHCSERLCGQGICLIIDQTYQCLCDQTNFQGEFCEYERRRYELTFHGQQYFKTSLVQSIFSSNEILSFQMKTNHYDGLLFQFIENQFYMKIRHGLLIIEYRHNHSWYEFSMDKNLNLIDNQWHFIQMKRSYGQLILIIDEKYMQMENDIKFDDLLFFNEFYLGGNFDLTISKFYGCLKDISIIFNENSTIYINQSNPLDYFHEKTCQSLINPIQFLSSSSYLSLNFLENKSSIMNISFRFETYSLDCILFYSQSNDIFLGLDLIDGFLSLTINIQQKKQRQELFQQRFNDGQTHFFQLETKYFNNIMEFNITMDFRQNTRILIRNFPLKINLQTLTIAGINPANQFLPSNFYAGILERGFIGCFADLEINYQLIDLNQYINQTEQDIPPRNGPCSISLIRKSPCLCEHDGECRINSNQYWSCDCSKTGYTGQRCEQLAYYLDLNQNQTLELNTNIQWSDFINLIAFNLYAIHDEENFLEIRPCRLIMKCSSIKFSIFNGLLSINYSTINLTIEYPFLLDQQWHSINFQRIHSNLLLHIDNHIIQQRVNISYMNESILHAVWIIFHGNKQIRIEDLKIYDRSIFTQVLKNQLKQIHLQTRTWKPLNTISFINQPNTYIEIPLNDILCQDCSLNSFYFQFRTTDFNGLILFACIRTRINSTINYILIKLINGHLHFVILNRSYHELNHIQTKQILNDNYWHYVSFYRASDYHIQIIIDWNEYFLLISIDLFERMFLGQSIHSHFLHPLTTIRACFASFTIDSHRINLREYIQLNSPIRNDCFLDSQCPLKPCFNHGICQERIQCNCQHTSFQGKYCTKLKLGYTFNNTTAGLIFDQPFIKDKIFSNYRLSFGIITKINTSEIIRINEQILIELYQGILRIRLFENDYLYHDQLINNYFYHLIQIEYNISGYLYLNIDNRIVVKQVKQKILFDKPLILFIGHHPTFKNSFQGQLYGLQSDIYSIFDLISPTFHRISFVPNRKKISLIYPLNYDDNDYQSQTCSYQPYDDICMVTSDNHLLYPNLTSFIRTSKIFFTSTLSSQTLTISRMNFTNTSSMTHIISISNKKSWFEQFPWPYIWILLLLIIMGMIICLIILICCWCWMKYRRKDAGVYELEETQRFRPLIIQLPPSPGEQRTISHSKKFKKHRSRLIQRDDQREFYI